MSHLQKGHTFMAKAATESYNAGSAFGCLMAKNNSHWTYEQAKTFANGLYIIYPLVKSMYVTGLLDQFDDRRK